MFKGPVPALTPFFVLFCSLLFAVLLPSKIYRFPPLYLPVPGWDDKASARTIHTVHFSYGDFDLYDDGYTTPNAGEVSSLPTSLKVLKGDNASARAAAPLVLPSLLLLLLSLAPAGGR